MLLPQSRFDCNGKNGYYADEDLGCEVFHYCQDNAKHSWICPEGFTFHQVHLICMPPGQDNICAKSSQFHFVNDFLYKPINLEEHQRKPNISLKYSDRYYPENYYSGQYEEESESRPQRKHSVSFSILILELYVNNNIKLEKKKVCYILYHKTFKVNNPLYETSN